MVQRKRTLGVDDLWSLKRVGVPSISPDGSSACAAVTRYDMKSNEASTDLWLFPTDGTAGRRLTAGDKDSEPLWSPDGRWIAFTAKRKDDDEPQIYVIAPDGGEAQRLTQLATGTSALRWFPDSKRIAFVSFVWPGVAGEKAQARRMKQRKDSKVKAHVTERSEFRFWDRWLTDGREPHVMAVDVATGHSRDLLAATGLALQPWSPSADHYDISPDGRELALSVDLAPEPGMMHECDVMTVDLRSGRRRTLTARSGFSDEQPRYSPDGRFLVWRSYNIKRAFNDQGRLTLFERGSRRTRRLASRLDRSVGRLAWAPDSETIYLFFEDRGHQSLHRLGLRDALPTRVVAGGHIDSFDIARNGSCLVFWRCAASSPPALFSATPGGSAERALVSPNRALMDAVRLGEVREFTVRGWGGEPVQIFVTYPPNFDPARKWPLLHTIHGGPHAAHTDSWHWRWNTQVFAAHGYVVLAVNYHGSSGFGQAWLESITANYGAKEFADTEAATDFMLRQGYIDPERLVAGGGSYGGFMVAYMNGHTDRYRAFVCHAGCYDWVSMMATDGYKFFAKELGGFHWDKPAQVMRQSPHHYARRFKTPTLVMHGELDYRVPATQALQYYDTLHARGVPARLVYFPDENHWILKPQNSRLWYSEFFAWLKRYASPGLRRGRSAGIENARRRAAGAWRQLR